MGAEQRNTPKRLLQLCLRKLVSTFVVKCSPSLARQFAAKRTKKNLPTNLHPPLVRTGCLPALTLVDHLYPPSTVGLCRGKPALRGIPYPAARPLVIHEHLLITILYLSTLNVKK